MLTKMPTVSNGIGPIEGNDSEVLGHVNTVCSGRNAHSDRDSLREIRRQLIIAATIDMSDAEAIYNAIRLDSLGRPTMLDERLDDDSGEIGRRAPILWDAPDTLDVLATRQSYSTKGSGAGSGAGAGLSGTRSIEL